MRFKSKIKAVGIFAKLCASLSSLSPIAWCRLSESDVRFTLLPEKGSQCWTLLRKDTLFSSYTIQSAAPENTINLEIPLAALTRALKSALNATEVWIRLTKKDNVPMLCLTIHTSTFVSANSVVRPERSDDEFGGWDLEVDLNDPEFGGAGDATTRERTTVITQDVPVRVRPMEDVAHLHEPSLREPDVHINMPNLAQLKSISERFAKLAMATGKTAPRLELSANMHGSLRLAIKTDALSISSQWVGLTHPELDASQFAGGEQEVRDHPSVRMRELGGPTGENEAGWARVVIDAKDWSRVLSVGRVSSRVIGCLMNDLALVMYCWISGPEDDEESCLTYFINSYSA